ncbi:MAG: deoxyribonuclease IV [Armatimonadetes bacterium]|nr:deoxyribonuclease IV [Armatimonadota bacterium]
MRLGLHVPVGEGLIKAAQRARRLGCECLQIFGRNARGWRGRIYAAEEVAGFRQLLGQHDIAPVVIHSCYLVNLASPDKVLRDRSLRSVADDMARAAALGARFVVFHFGHHMGTGPDAGVRCIASALKSLLRAGPSDVQLLLENSAGRGSELGAGWDDFVKVLDLLHGDERVGVCFDTCHAHAAGHRLDGPQRVGRVLRAVATSVSLDRVRLIHLNDSRAASGEHVDHHEHIGRGTIGEIGLRSLLGRRELRDRGAILETPVDRPGDDRRNLTRAKHLRDR